MPPRTKILSFISIGLSLIAACLLIPERSARVAAANPMAQGPAGGKLVDETRKNIQVLKGLPEAQLTPLMNFVASSLGVRCEHCHVQQGTDPKTGFTNWIWESDDKPQKQTARRMMRMVLSLNATNKTDFRENAVTCFTCHQGQLAPVGLPPMPLARSGHEPDPNEAAIDVSKFPSLEEIFGRYMEALGGSAAIGTKSLVMKGTREASQNRNWPNEITVAGSDRFLVVATPGQGVVRQIIKGDQGWMANGPNVRTLGAAEVIDTRRSWAELFNVMKVRQSPGMRVAGVRKVGERESWLVESVTPGKSESYYFDAQSGLLLRKTTINQTLLVPLPEQIDFEDYRDVAGAKVPFTIRYSAIDTFFSWTRKFTEVKRDVAVDESLFAKP